MKRFAILLICLMMILPLLTGAGTKNPESSGVRLPTIDGESVEIVQFVSSPYSSVFAVLYSNGSVGIGGQIYEDQSTNLSDYDPALEWKNVKKLYLNQSTLIGLCEDGTVYSVGTKWDDDYVPLQTDHLRNVVDVAFLEPGSSYFFLLEDGTVRCEMEGSPDSMHDIPFDGSFASWKGVKQLIPYFYYDIFGIFEDGTVKSMGEYGIAKDQSNAWKDIQQLYVDNRYYGVKKNGSVVIYDPYAEFSSKIPNEAGGLRGAVEMYSAGDVMFGLDKKGELLVSGGKNWFRNQYGKDTELTPWSELTKIEELYVSRDYGLEYVMAVRTDGKAVALQKELNDALSFLKDVQKLEICFSTNGDTYICGLQPDGNVVGIVQDHSDTIVIYNKNFGGWNVMDLYAAKFGAMIGFNTDGSISYTTDPESPIYVEYLTPAGFYPG